MKVLFIHFLLFSILFFSLSCNRKTMVDDIENEPKITSEEKVFVNVYKPLDGEWKGIFYIYEDTARVKKNDKILYNLTKTSLDKQALKLVNTIKVKQKYASLSPYFQTVEITDFEPSSGKTYMSKGVNKVQEGELWCVVRKADETVIHKGSLPEKDVIVWQRNEKIPQKIEYFYEIVTQNQYEIIGWGYYEGDDASLMPKYWFYGNYERTK